MMIKHRVTSRLQCTQTVKVVMYIIVQQERIAVGQEKDVYITFTATDKSDCGTEGSGVKQFMYRYGSSGNWQSVGATKNDNKW